MASTYSNLKIQLMATGENSGTWGNVTNTNLGTALEEAIVGSADVTFSSGTVTLTLTDTNSSQTARNLRLNLTGTSGGAQNLIVPAIEKVYLVNNGCADAITIKNSSGTGIAVPAGKTMWVYNNGTNVVDAVTHLTSLTLASALPVASGGTGTTTSTGSGNVVLSTSPTLVTPVLGTPSSGTLTSCTGLPLTTGVTGTLPVANGGTGVTTSTGSGNVVLSTSPTLVTPALGTPSSGTLTNCTGLPIATGVSGLGTNVATFLATPSSANLAAAVTGETGSGALVFATSPTLVTPALGTPSSGTLTSCTGLPLSTGVTGTLPIANGGTGSTSTTYCSLTTNVTGTLPVANGGTGVTSSTGTGNVVLSASPTLTGTPIAPTAANGTNTTQIATTAFVGTAITNLSLGTMSTQNANNVAITGGTINVSTINVSTLGSSGRIYATSPNSGSSGGVTITQNPSGGVVYLQFTNSDVTSEFADIGVTSAGLMNLTATGGVQINGSPIGVGVDTTSWHGVTGSRALNTTYTNSRSYPIMVNITIAYTASGSNSIVFYVGGQVVAYEGGNVSTDTNDTVSFIVPPNTSYSTSITAGSISLSNWAELY